MVIENVQKGYQIIKGKSETFVFGLHTPGKREIILYGRVQTPERLT